LCTIVALQLTGIVERSHALGGHLPRLKGWKLNLDIGLVLAFRTIAAHRENICIRPW
jgi:hypothetical protein